MTSESVTVLWALKREKKRLNSNIVHRSEVFSGCKTDCAVSWLFPEEFIHIGCIGELLLIIRRGYIKYGDKWCICVSHSLKNCF